MSYIFTFLNTNLSFKLFFIWRLDCLKLTLNLNALANDLIHKKFKTQTRVNLDKSSNFGLWNEKSGKSQQNSIEKVCDDLLVSFLSVAQREVTLLSF